jgi:hypothetical protein
MQILDIAVENGHAEKITFAVSHGPLSEDVVLGIIRAGRLECLKIVAESRPELLPECALVFAAAHGFFDGVRYLHGRGFPLSDEANPIDAEGLLWLREALRFHVYVGVFQSPPAPGGTLSEQQAWEEEWGDVHVPKDPWQLDEPWSYITWPADDRADLADEGTPGLERERGKGPRAEGDEDPLRAELVRALGNYGVGGEALMDPDVGLVPQRSGEPPLLCAWQTVAAASSALAAHPGDMPSRLNAVRARRWN